MPKRLTLAVAILVTLSSIPGCGGSDDSGGGGGGGSGGGGASGGGGGTTGDCTQLQADLDAKLAEASKCTPNSSSCEIVTDDLCNCAAVQTGSEGPYLAAANAFKTAGCKLTCSGLVCPTAATCKPEGTCAPSF